MDAHWHELEQRARTIARYDTAYGSCPVCNLGATAIDRPTGFGAWCRCVICNVAWRSPVQDLHVAPGGQPDDEDPDGWLEGMAGEEQSPEDEWRAEFTYFTLLEIAQAHRFDQVAQQPTTAEETMKKNPTNEPTTIDPTTIDPADLTQHTRAVDAAVTAAEALTLDDPGAADAVARGRDAVDAVRAAAMDVCFPRGLTPVSQTTFDDFTFHVDTAGVLPFERIDPVLVRLHGDAIASHPELAAVIRGARGQSLVRLHARRAANPDPVETERAEAKAIAAFVAGVSVQLQGRGLLMPASEILAERVGAWMTRIDAVARRHAEHQAAKARAAEEAEAAERATLDAIARGEESQRRAARLASEDPSMRGRREQLADFFRRHPGFRFPVGGKMLSGPDCARDVEEGAPFADYYNIQSQGMPVRRGAGVEAAR